MATPSRASTITSQFAAHWQASTADSNLGLHGFRRFKTTHLLNLRYLEAEIAEVDHTIYQLGLHSDVDPTDRDRLGLKHCKKDEEPPKVDQDLTEDLITRLRRLLKEYDDAIMAFNFIMSMETFSLIDGSSQSWLRHDLSLNEVYKTRLIRVDQAPRARQDPLQRGLHQLLRFLRFWRISREPQQNPENAGSASIQQFSPQNTTLITDIASRVITAAFTGGFLTFPLVIISNTNSRDVQLGQISACIVAFACFVSVALRASNLEMMVISAAYAAVLAVFLSNPPSSSA